MRGGRRYFRAPATPFNIGSGLVAEWWSAQDIGLMINDGAGLISNWISRVSGLAVTATTTARATYGATSFNTSYPGLTFDGTANCYVTTTLATLPTGATETWLWLVGTQTAGQTTNTGAYGSTGANDVTIGGSAAFKGRITDGTTVSVDGGSNVVSSPFLLCGQWVSTTQNGWVNGTALTTNPATITTINTGTTRLRIGAGNGVSASQFFGGVLSDFMVTKALSTLQRQQIEGYLAWNRGLVSVLPTNHPYKGAPP